MGADHRPVGPREAVASPLLHGAGRGRTTRMIIRTETTNSKNTISRCLRATTNFEEVGTNDHGKHENRWPLVSFGTRGCPVAGHSMLSCCRHRIFLEPDVVRACTGSDLYCMRHRACRFLLWHKAR